MRMEAGFVGGAAPRAPLASAASSLAGVRVCAARGARAPPRRAAAAAVNTPRMADDEYFDPQDDRIFSPGFTTYAERFNGRAAMIGFMIALAYELLTPDQSGLVPVLLGLIGKGGGAS